MFIHFSIFPSTFPTADFPIHFAQGGVQNGVWIELHISKSTLMNSDQRSKVTCMWKIIFVECRPVVVVNGEVHRDPNAIAARLRRDCFFFFFFQTHAKRSGMVSM